MGIRFSAGRIAIFIACAVTINLIGGCDPPDLPARMYRSWAAALMMFWIGAVSISFVEHSVGHMEPRTDLRFVYVVMGLLLMGGAAFFLHGMRGTGSQ